MSGSRRPIDPNERSVWARALWTGLGLSCVAVGAVGVVLPGLPTTPFLVLAAACFSRSSRRWYNWLIEHRTFGPLIRDFRAGRGISLRIKVFAISLMWVFVAFALGPGLPAGNVWLRVIVGTVAVIGTVYLLRLPTKRVDAPATPPESKDASESAGNAPDEGVGAPERSAATPRSRV